MQRVSEIISRYPYYELIEHDLYSIASRLKDISDGYFLVRNRRRNKFEVHNIYNIGSTYCFTVPFDKLDNRTLIYCRETNVGFHGDDIVKRLEKYNEELEEQRHKEAINDFEAAGYDAADMIKMGVLKDEMGQDYKQSVYVSGYKGGDNIESN